MGHSMLFQIRLHQEDIFKNGVLKRRVFKKKKNYWLGEGKMAVFFFFEKMAVESHLQNRREVSKYELHFEIFHLV